MPLHLDYRPKKLEEVVGNDAVKASLKSVLTRSDHPHAFLFHGGSGCGKTTLGRIIANELKCEPEDVYEYNAANTRGIDTVRGIAENMNYSALMGKIKVYILDEAHQITDAAANALLKLLEDYPKHVYFILCTTEPEKIIATVRNRCTQYQVKPLLEAQMKKLLSYVLEKEKVKNFPEKVIKEIIRVSEGCPRQALVILDSVIDIEDDEEAFKAVSSITVGDAEVNEICMALINGIAWKDLKGKVKTILEKYEPEKLRYSIIGYCAAIMLSRNECDRLSEIIDLFSEATYTTGRAGIINAMYLAAQTSGKR